MSKTKSYLFTKQTLPLISDLTLSCRSMLSTMSMVGRLLLLLVLLIFKDMSSSAVRKQSLLLLSSSSLDYVEQCKGSAASNIAYCKKEGNWTEWGTPPKSSEEAGQMEKDRWALARANARKRNFDEIPDDIYIKHYSAIKRIAAESQQDIEPLSNVCGYWLWGDAGTGKSTLCSSSCPWCLSQSLL